MTTRNIIRLLGVTLALLVLVIFVTGVVSDWSHQGPSDDARCPYCHMGHQTPAQLAIAPSGISLKPVAFLLLAVEVLHIVGPIYSQTAPRAPPV
ncbi:MAG TPA: hypothetical protein VK709_13195 [Candidatus Saccharimonadales bacterium]|jgi:hypothetical protein|nr:hypothetical protein [Candidatus Saccharimonadales bacterium]